MGCFKIAKVELLVCGVGLDVGEGDVLAISYSSLGTNDARGKRVLIITAVKWCNGLIHSDLCDFQAAQSLGNKKYFVKFINDAYRAVVRLPDPKLKTLGERGIECIFVRYAEHSKDFRFYFIEPNEFVSINLIIKSKDAIFDENRFSSVSRPSLMIPNGTKDIGVSKVYGEVPSRVTYEKKAIDDEIDSIMGKDTWVLIDLPLGCKPLVAHINTIRLLIALASIHNLVIHQMDMKIAFLNSELEEEVYINQPQGFILSGNENKVNLIKGFLSSRFFMKDMREANVILVSTHMDTTEKLKPNNGRVVSQLEYSRVIGYLMCAMTCIRPGIYFVVGKLSRGGAISWACKKQTCITCSTMEFEFMALATAG
ncbi:zinc finger, CCHC-type containing protein [Tanacetum coccineum]